MISPQAYITKNSMRVGNWQYQSNAGSGSTKSLFYLYFAIFLVVLYVSNINDYYYGRGSVVKPLYWHVLTVCAAMFLLLSRPGGVIHRYPKAFLIWVAAYLVQLLIAFLLSSQTETAIDQLIYGLETSALIFSFLVLLFESNSKVLLSSLVVVVLFSVCLNLYDFLNPTFTRIPGRASGFYLNPNVAGKFIGIAMVISCIAVPKNLRLPYCLFVGLGILVTFSRSSWFLWAIGITGLAATGHLFLQKRTISVVVLGGLGMLVVYTLLSGTMLTIFQSMGIEQYLQSDTVTRLGGGGSSFEDASAISRAEMVRFSISEFQNHPWFGAGLGATAEWMSLDRPHNLYLMVAVEGGIFGLLVLGALISILWSHANSIGRVAVILFAVSSVFDHNNLEQAGILCLIAVIVVALGRQSQSLEISPQKFVNTTI